MTTSLYPSADTRTDLEKAQADGLPVSVAQLLLWLPTFALVNARPHSRIVDLSG
jgi:hypothetical protein